MRNATALGRRRRARHKPPLSVRQILAWADAHHARTGKWANLDSGRVFGAADEKWTNLDGNLRVGARGLSAGSSLARLLVEFRGRLLVPFARVRGLDLLGDLVELEERSWVGPRAPLRETRFGLASRPMQSAVGSRQQAVGSGRAYARSKNFEQPSVTT